MVNRTQAVVLGFFLLAVISLLVILAAAPKVYDQALRLPTGNRVVEIAVLAALIGFVTLLGVGVVRRWRWTFWLVLVAFLAGVLRVPVAVYSWQGSWRPMPLAGMSPSRGCWVSSSSPSAWPWWRVIVALASGGSSERRAVSPQSTRSKSGALDPFSLLCSVNDAVNVLPCSTCVYINGGPVLTCVAFPG
jgi:hypothetical protein